MSLAGGFWKDEHDLSQAAENFWFAHEVTHRRVAFGRELAALTADELESISGYRHSLHETQGSKHLNDAILIELAKSERETRCNESNLARMAAVTTLADTKEFLAGEARRAKAWWDSLSSDDRSSLPHYDYKNLDTASRAIFTYRDILERKSRWLRGKTCRVDLGPLQAQKRSRRKVSEETSVRSVA